MTDTTDTFRKKKKVKSCLCEVTLMPIFFFFSNIFSSYVLKVKTVILLVFGG